MHAARFLPLLVSLTLFAVAEPALAQQGAAAASVRVELKQAAGPVPYAYRAGVFLNSLPGGYAKHMFLSEQRPGMVELSIDFYPPLANASSEEEFFARLPASNLSAWVRDTAAAGGEPYIRLMPVPRWLWSGANGARRPPRDWAAWERFVQRLVAYFNNELKIDVRYVVWDEPDNFWEGSADDYLLLYKHAAAGVLRANRKARIGGPALSFFSAPMGKKGGAPFLPAFIRYCATTPVPGLADRLPINMLVWHTFDAAPVSPGQYDFEVKQARALLRKHGYGEDVELNVGSWAALEKFPEAPGARDSEFLASFIVSSVIAMQRAQIDRHAFFNLYEDWRRNRDEFSDDMGLTTHGYVAKAGYQAYRLLGLLQGELLKVSVSDAFVQATAAREGRMLRLLVSNFPPPRKMLRVLATKRLLATGRTPQELRAIVPDLQQLQALMQDRRRIESWEAPADVRNVLLGLYDAAQRSARRQHEPLLLDVVLEGLPPGRYRLREHRIDARSANPFASREAVERAARAGQVAEVNARAGKELLDGSWRSVQVAGGSPVRMSIPPYGVMLLEAERAD